MVATSFRGRWWWSAEPAGFARARFGSVGRAIWWCGGAVIGGAGSQDEVGQFGDVDGLGHVQAGQLPGVGGVVRDPVDVAVTEVRSLDAVRDTALSQEERLA